MIARFVFRNKYKINENSHAVTKEAIVRLKKYKGYFDTTTNKHEVLLKYNKDEPEIIEIMKQHGDPNLIKICEEYAYNPHTKLKDIANLVGLKTLTSVYSKLKEIRTILKIHKYEPTMF